MPTKHIECEDEPLNIRTQAEKTISGSKILSTLFIIFSQIGLLYKRDTRWLQVHFTCSRCGLKLNAKHNQNSTKVLVWSLNNGLQTTITWYSYVCPHKNRLQRASGSVCEKEKKAKIVFRTINFLYDTPSKRQLKAFIVFLCALHLHPIPWRKRLINERKK